MDELTLACTLGLGWVADAALFLDGGKVRKTLHQAHPGVHEHQLESEKKMNLALGENLEDLHLNGNVNDLRRRRC